MEMPLRFVMHRAWHGGLIRRDGGAVLEGSLLPGVVRLAGSDG
ncbi:hypothetical protein ACFCX0_45135 [Streptomyces sp. NPDC056352]